MKAVRKLDERGAYMVVKKASSMPYLAAGVAVLVYGAKDAIVNPMDYLKGAIIAAVAFAIARAIWPDRKQRIDLPPDTGDAQCDQLVLEAREALVAIRAANDQIADPALSACIDGIETSCRKILVRLEEQPALHGQLRTFLRYYLPTTRKLLDARAAFEKGDATSDNAREARERTERVLPQIRDAFERQLDAMDKHRYLDLQVEMDVLEGMLKSDGFSSTQNGK